MRWFLEILQDKTPNFSYGKFVIGRFQKYLFNAKFNSFRLILSCLCFLTILIALALLYGCHVKLMIPTFPTLVPEREFIGRESLKAQMINLKKSNKLLEL